VPPHIAAILTGHISVGSLLTLFTAIVGFATVIANQRTIKARTDHVARKVESIDNSVNGKAPGEGTLRQNVQDLHDRHSSARTRATDPPANGHQGA
jgi:hypothetical protein